VSLQRQYQDAIRERDQFEQDAEVMRKKLNHIISTQIDKEEYEKLSDECSSLRRNVQDLTTRYDALQQKHRQIAEENIELRRVHENDLIERMTLQRKMMDASGSPTSETTPNGDEITLSAGSDKKSRFMNIAKMKMTEQKLQREIAHRSALEAELATLKQSKTLLEKELEEYRRANHGTHEDNASPRAPSVLSTFGLLRKPSIDSLFRQRRSTKASFTFSGK
jgi:cell division protein FtsB